MTKSILTVFGLALLLIGGTLYVTSPAISENDAIQSASRLTKAPNGEAMYEITDVEIRGAYHQRASTNAARANKRQIGAVLAIPGASLLIVGLAMGRQRGKTVEA